MIQHGSAVGDYTRSFPEAKQRERQSILDHKLFHIQPPLNFPGMFDTNHLLGVASITNISFALFSIANLVLSPMNRD
jgi:hypothetical protein